MCFSLTFHMRQSRPGEPSIFVLGRGRCYGRVGLGNPPPLLLSLLPAHMLTILFEGENPGNAGKERQTWVLSARNNPPSSHRHPLLRDSSHPIPNCLCVPLPLSLNGSYRKGTPARSAASTPQWITWNKYHFPHPHFALRADVALWLTAEEDVTWEFCDGKCECLWPKVVMGQFWWLWMPPSEVNHLRWI